MVIRQIGSVDYHWYRSGVLGKVAGGSWDHHNPPTKDGFFVSQETYLEIHDIFGSLAHNHQSSNNTTVRVGDTTSDSSKAGVFHSTTAAESTPGSHGEGTDYCGRVVHYEHNSYYTQYWISTGISQTSMVTGTRRVDSACLGYSISTSDYAHCANGYNNGQCPRGWGNRASYINYQPGCREGTYYPNPTPASLTNVFTGSCNDNHIP